MLKNLIQDLNAVYRENLLDYEELLEEMGYFKNKLSGDRTQNNINNVFDRDESPSRTSPLKIEQSFEHELIRFSALRDVLFKKLRGRSEKINELQKRIGVELGSTSFQVADLKPHLEETAYNELLFLIEALNTKMNEVLQLDDYIIPRLKMELEAVKLELHRIQGAKRTKNAYENQGQREARFIDKIK
jgi:hypothetical protein